VEVVRWFQSGVFGKTNKNLFNLPTGKETTPPPPEEEFRSIVAAEEVAVVLVVGSEVIRTPCGCAMDKEMGTAIPGIET